VAQPKISLKTFKTPHSIYETSLIARAATENGKKVEKTGWRRRVFLKTLENSGHDSSDNICTLENALQFDT